jgi:plasmid stability protein
MPDDSMIQFTLRLPREIVTALRERAAQEDRSPSAEIRRLIRQHIMEPQQKQTA